MEKFESTLSGYFEAQRWLIETGKWDEISLKCNSNDIIPIVDIANLLWKQSGFAPLTYMLDEAGQYQGHGTPFLVDELAHWKFDKSNYIGGSDPITSGKSSIGVESTIKIKKDGD